MVHSRSVLKAVVVVGAASSTLTVALPARMNTANGEAGPLATTGNTPHSEAVESVPRRTAAAPSYRGVPPPPPPAPPVPEDHRNNDHRGRELDDEAAGNDFTVGNAAVTLSNRGTPPTHRPGTPSGGSSTKSGRPKLSSRGSPPPPPPPPPPRYPLFGAFSRPKDFRRRALDSELVAAENDVTGRTAATLSSRGTPPPPPPAPPVPKGHRNNGHIGRELDSETAGNDFTGGGTIAPLSKRGIPPPPPPAPPIPKTEAFKHKDFRDREPHLATAEGFSGRTGATLSSRGYPPPPAPAPPVPKHEGSKNKSHRGRELDIEAAGKDVTGHTTATLSSRRTPPPPPPPPPVPKAKALRGRDLDAIVEDDDSESDSHHGHYEPFGEEDHYDHHRHHYPYEDEVDVEEGQPDHYHRLPYGADLD
ncbi:hypothetical protein F5880DRAFT_1520514 [Lentinula raphanica]|nr:hypothetical protein F5880DRAFT_1520514 [Lentinula raphanica]